MKIKNLFKNIPVQAIHGSKEVDITGICANSKLVAPGNLFIAKKGLTHHGAQYIPQAVQAGGSAVLTDIFNPSLKNIVQIIHPKVNEIEPLVATEFFQRPSESLFMVGITGTKGKTTTSYAIKYLLDHFFGPCGLIGTIEYIVGENRYPATRTTPDVISNHQMLREMVTHGCRSAVMEVTSHALDQGRVELIDYDVAIFSNLTLDHLDYHHDMETYCLAKNRLFRQLGQQKTSKKQAKVAIINADSPWSAKVIQGCKVPIMTYGIDQDADLKATDVHLGKQMTELNLLYQGKKVPCQWPLIGRFNVYNCLSAILTLLSKGFALEEIADRMSQIPSVRGRLEPVANQLGLKIYIDFAHTDDSLLNVLKTLKEFKQGRLITVFGCGGDRDRSKRPKMAAVSEQYSDVTIVTSDNPRTEDPELICREIIKGFSKPDSFIVELDRRLAIQKAIEMADSNDTILIAGKGHEPTQIFAHKTIEFDDCQVAADICSALGRV